MTKDLYSEYTSNSYSSIIKKTTTNTIKKRKRLKQAPLRRVNDQKALEKVFREMQTKTIIR